MAADTLSFAANANNALQYRSVTVYSSVPPPDGGIGAALVVYVDQQYRGFRESKDYGTPKQFTFPRTATEIGER